MSSASCDMHSLGPRSECVLPAPVWPYANTVATWPSQALCTRALTPLREKSSACEPLRAASNCSVCSPAPEPLGTTKETVEPSPSARAVSSSPASCASDGRTLTATRMGRTAATSAGSNGSMSSSFRQPSTMPGPSSPRGLSSTILSKSKSGSPKSEKTSRKSAGCHRLSQSTTMAAAEAVRPCRRCSAASSTSTLVRADWRWCGMRRPWKCGAATARQVARAARRLLSLVSTCRNSSRIGACARTRSHSAAQARSDAKLASIRCAATPSCEARPSTPTAMASAMTVRIRSFSRIVPAATMRFRACMQSLQSVASVSSVSGGCLRRPALLEKTENARHLLQAFR
mmetsp:Transcript_5614/g.17665  ORF Transcript_5614/g.17665 Transcript_5614/m.17665 type:complete len:344 (+) Transcript_5614:1157-2188(+)